jgi:hypothetical protein
LTNASHALGEGVFSGVREADSISMQCIEVLGLIAGEPLLMVLQKPLTAAAHQQGGCGCGGCDRPDATKCPSAKVPSDMQAK